MKTFLLKLSFVLTCSALPILSQAKVVTLGVDSGKTMDSISIGTNEVGTIVTFQGGDQGICLNIMVAGVTNTWCYILDSGSSRVVAGPAIIQLKYYTGTNPGFCTIKVEPESFPPDKTLIIPADSHGANIIMEASPDLVHWTNSVPGLYTNATGNMFFRIRADRIP